MANVIKAKLKIYNLCHVRLDRCIKKLKSGDTNAKVGYHSAKRIFLMKKKVFFKTALYNDQICVFT